MKTILRYVILSASLCVFIKFLALRRDISLFFDRNMNSRYKLISEYRINYTKHGINNHTELNKKELWKQITFKLNDTERKDENIPREGSIMEGRIIGEKYRLIRPVGRGAFGTVYMASDIETEELVAVKLEDSFTFIPRIAREEKIYRALSGAEGFPVVKWRGKTKRYNIMAMELLGPSMISLLDSCGIHFSLKTVLLLADQMLSRLESLHSKGFISRDVKPDNFVIGLGNKSHVIYGIDFGVSKPYQGNDGHHVPYAERESFAGTTRYASINTQRGIRQSRRDDMESLGYVLIFFLKGQLPWQGLGIKDEYKRHKRIFHLKATLSFEDLCNGCPVEFYTYLKICRSLQFEEKPDYQRLRLLFSNLLQRQNQTSDFMFDWHVPNGTCGNIKI